MTITINPNQTLTSITTTLNLAAVETLNFLKASVEQGFVFNDGQLVEVLYSNGSGIFAIAIDSTGITLSPVANIAPGSSTVGDFAIFSDTSGAIDDSGQSASNPGMQFLAAVEDGQALQGYIATFIDTNGTIGFASDPLLFEGALQGGNATGVQGSVLLFPNVANTGSLFINPQPNSGDYATFIENAAFGQSTTLTIPDPGDDTASFSLTTGVVVDDHIPLFNGTTGLLKYSGYGIIAKTTASWTGGDTSHGFTATGLTTGAIVTANILTSANDVSITKVVPTTDTLTITFSADPGTGTTVNYIATTAES